MSAVRRGEPLPRPGAVTAATEAVNPATRIAPATTREPQPSAAAARRPLATTPPAAAAPPRPVGRGGGRSRSSSRCSPSPATCSLSNTDRRARRPPRSATPHDHDDDRGADHDHPGEPHDDGARARPSGNTVTVSNLDYVGRPASVAVAALREDGLDPDGPDRPGLEAERPVSLPGALRVPHR